MSDKQVPTSPDPEVADALRRRLMAIEEKIKLGALEQAATILNSAGISSYVLVAEVGETLSKSWRGSKYARYGLVCALKAELDKSLELEADTITRAIQNQIHYQHASLDSKPNPDSNCKVHSVHPTPATGLPVKESSSENI